MHGVFDQQDYQPLGRQRDTELTLGPFKLLALFFGLVLLCGLCFGLGYAVGNHSAKNASVAAPPAAVTPPPTTMASTHSNKPSANPQNASQRAAASVQPSASSASSPSTPSDANHFVVQYAPPPAPAARTGQWVVKPALPSQSAQPQPVPAQLATASKAQASQSPPLMVQIAAVSHSEDAQVLVSALRRRGFAVTVRHEPADGLLHVQVGPFASRTEAAAMRQKLLNDGYNAIVQP
jgi:cell division protein FtsN